ncbi:MAG: 1-acyl-sn-glycerol-3-phosphate acyltransferase [Bacteroidia bacterium]|nr:MAG: 1-acyl-sn-glycerol-3-phosphate acyltransferase [Bacteroidia bacterium]
MTLQISSDEYNTSVQATRKSTFASLKRSRLVFILRYLGTVLRTRRQALDGLYDTSAWAESSLEILQLLENAGARFHVSGLDNIRKSAKPVVFISNHMSTLETMILPGLIAPITDVTFVVKDSLVNHPLFGPVMRSRDPVTVARTNSRDDLVKVMTEGSSILESGRSIVIFPQSTRREKFNPSEFNTLGVKLASRNRVTVIPIALRTDFWKNGRIVKDLGPFDRSAPVMIRFGLPMTVSGQGKDEHNSIINFISSSLEEWGSPV